MSNLKSTEVQIFPFGSPRDSDSYARILDEFNIRRIMKSIVDRPSYVISANNDNSRVEFVIEGYYFNVDLTSILNDTTFKNQPIYAIIELKSTNGHEYLVGGDDQESFTGLEFSIEAETAENHYSLELLNAERKIPTNSLVKFNVESFENITNYVTKEDLEKTLDSSYYTQTQTQDIITSTSYTKEEVDNKLSDALDISVIYCGTSEDLID